MQATEIVKALRCCASIGWSGCSFCQREELAAEEVGCGDALKLSAADRLEELLDRCARYAEEIAVLLERRRWIPVTERLPESFVPVIVCRDGAPGERIVEQGHKDVGDWWKVYGTRTKRVTHWMPLPPAPEVE